MWALLYYAVSKEFGIHIPSLLHGVPYYTCILHISSKPQNECHGCRETRARSCESVGHGLERSSTRVLVSGLFSRSGSEFGVMWVYWTGLNIGDKFPAVLVWLNRYMPSRTSRHSGIARYALNP